MAPTGTPEPQTQAQKACCAASARGRRIYLCDVCRDLTLDVTLTPSQAKYVLSEKRHVWIVGPQAEGKCLLRDTPVMMADGRIVPVQDIVVGDRLMGEDSQPRTVMALGRGEETAYRIVPTRGEPFACNASHILSLKRSGSTNRKPDYKRGNIVDISVRDYLAASTTFRLHHLLYRVPLTFPKQAVMVDPYWMGLWLGDGTSCRPEITTADPEIVEYLSAVAAAAHLSLLQCPAGGRSSTYCFSNGQSKGKRSRNIFSRALDYYQVRNNKHIPHAYKVNDRESRMRLLAGLIDTDGWVNRTSYQLTFKQRRLADDVAFVARSLGFFCSVKPSIKKIASRGFVGQYWRLTIDGACHEIPIRLKRKSVPVRRQQKDVLVSGIRRIDPLGVQPYYGFTLAEDPRFLLGDCTVTHNTWASILGLILHAQRQPPQLHPITGHRMPCKYFFIRDTHATIERVTVPAFHRGFPGVFRFSNNNHLATAPGLTIDLFGMDRADDLPKIQGGEYDGGHIEEPAPIIAQGPSGPIVNAGISREVFQVAATRMRGGTSQKRLSIGMNPADRSHWTFYERELNPAWQECTEVVHIRPGENPHISAEDRQAVKNAFKDRPDLYARYVLGKESEVYPGVAVTPEYNLEWHRAPMELDVSPSAENFLFFDGGLNPTPYSADTEILTESGWKLIAETTIGERVMTLHPETFRLEWQAIEQKVHRRHVGAMYSWQCNDYDVRVTDDHAMPYLTNQARREKRVRIATKPARSAPRRMAMPRSGEWIGTLFSYVVLPAYQTDGRYFKRRPAAIIDIYTYCAFMGLYLSEGSSHAVRSRKGDTHPNHYHVHIWQKQRDVNFEKILNSMPFQWTWIESKQCWRAASVQLYHHLKPFGKAPEKYVPDVIKQLPPPLIKIFLDHYMMGDGSKTDGARLITTASKRMADDLQELYLKIGLSANVVTKDLRGKRIRIRGRESVINKLLYLVRISTKSKFRHLTARNLTIEQVSGESVYCVTVPNHIVYVRRNGKALWGGNCVLAQLMPSGRLHLLDCVSMENAGMRQMIRTKLIPLLNAPRWKPARVFRALGDDSLKNREQSDSDFSAAQVIQTELAPWLRTNPYEGGIQDWTLRRESIKTLLDANVGGVAKLLVNPVTTPGEPWHRIHAALAGGYCYRVVNGVVQRDGPEKNVHSHVGDAITHAVAKLFGVPVMPNLALPDYERQVSRAKGYSVGVYVPGQGGLG